MRKKTFAVSVLIGVLLMVCIGCAAEPSDDSGIGTGTTEETAREDSTFFEDFTLMDEPPVETGSIGTSARETESSVPTTQKKNLGALYEKYVYNRVRSANYTLRFRKDGLRLTVSVDNGNTAFESEAAGLLHFSLIHKDGDYFLLSRTTRKYAVITAEEFAKQASEIDIGEMDFDRMRLRSSGEETIAGKKYRTEVYDEGDTGVVTYFFDEEGLRRSRIVRNGQTNEIEMFEVSAGTEATAFRVPDGYTRTDNPGALFTP